MEEGKTSEFKEAAKYLWREDGMRFSRNEKGTYSMDKSGMAKPYQYTYGNLMGTGFFSVYPPEKKVNPKFKRLIVVAEVRYWEDATVNGIEDVDGELIPNRVGNSWLVSIDLETGIISDWPKGTTADIHYKVCDGGEYFLLDEEWNQYKYKGHYVPDKLLCMGERGCGDYIILKIDENGKIANWLPFIEDDEWEKEIKG